MAEKAAKDLLREEWVEELGLTTLLEDLVEVVALMDVEVVEEAEEVTLEEVVVMVKLIPVGEEEDPTMLEKINRMNVVTIQLDMVR